MRGKMEKDFEQSEKAEKSLVRKGRMQQEQAKHPCSKSFRQKASLSFSEVTCGNTGY